VNSRSKYWRASQLRRDLRRGSPHSLAILALTAVVGHTILCVAGFAYPRANLQLLRHEDAFNEDNYGYLTDRLRQQ